MTFIPRKSFEPGGFAYEYRSGNCRPLAPNVAGRIQDDGIRCPREWRDLTWDEVMTTRRKHQAEQLERIRRTIHRPAILPCYVWTFFNRQIFPYGGWYCYVVTRQFEDAVNFREFNAPLATSIMTEIPLGILPMAENFIAWMPAFARAYPRHRNWPGGKVFTPNGKRDPRKSGVLHGWLINRRTFSLQRPSGLPL